MKVSLPELGSSVLLFSLVFGMSATVEVKQLLKQIRNRTALLIGIGMQFFVLPMIGFCAVKVFQLPSPVGIALLVVTSSPGGSYSNWWCSLFNAELSLSVTMTALSTLVSTIMLPTNLLLYARWTYSSEVVESLEWNALFFSLLVVSGAIGSGLLASHRATLVGNHRRFHRRANLMGNSAGLMLVVLSCFLTNTHTNVRFWDQNFQFFVGVGLPAVFGLFFAVFLASKFDLEKPERVAVAVESCYQNTGIATSVAMTMFANNEDQLATAVGVPLYYGLVEAFVLLCFCLVCWKRNWTKAPADESLVVMLFKSYEVEAMEGSGEDAIEVMLCADGTPRKTQKSLIFSHVQSGQYVVDDSTLEKVPSEDDEQTELDISDEYDDDFPIDECESGIQSSPAFIRQRRPFSPAGSLSKRVEDKQSPQQNGIAHTLHYWRGRVAGYHHPSSPSLINSPGSDADMTPEKKRRPANYVMVLGGSPTTPSSPPSD